ncbi:MAG: hypothetical protein J7501_14265 [Bdellovibrio sp.]|nr:hypothetical protein [Bdellovibrio sp.]
MRLKFFLISLLVLVLTTFSISTLLLHYFRGERIDYIDNQIRQTATSIIDSELTDLRAYDYEKVDSIISEELGPDRIDKFFVIRTNEGKNLYKSQSIDLLNLEIPQSPQWVTLHKEGRMIRAVNLKLPRSKTRTLQVGVISDDNFFHLVNIDEETLLYIVATLSLFLGMTWILSASLFSPVREVAGYMKDATRSLDLNREIQPLPGNLLVHMQGPLVNKTDEFRSLLTSISTFTGRINAIRIFTRQWAFQMAHEIKTPLTILNRDVERLAKTHNLSEEETSALSENVEKVSRTITNFLNWAELTNQGQAENLHVIKIQSTLARLSPNWIKIFGERLSIEGQTDFQLMCNPDHFEQFLNNLVINALKYSNDNVQLRVGSHSLEVSDRGPGIPESVLQKWGTPFNKGPRSDEVEGTGLGLAWVKTVAEIYRWDLKVHSDSSGTKITTIFPEIATDKD